MAQPAPHRIPVPLKNGYAVCIGPGVVRDLPAFLKDALPGVRYGLVTDTNVERLHAPAVRSVLSDAGIDVHTIVVPAGEAHKTRATKDLIEDRMADARFGRDSALLALGGGVVGDIAGFTAATWNRGIPYVQLPTTLLAMVDSSVGGKTGVDHPAGKNLIGAFHQPRGVFTDVDFLSTLPEREFRSGLAEVVKCGVIRRPALLAGLSKGTAGLEAREPSLLMHIVAEAVATKVSIVTQDEREGDLRQILNFGHTIGHALESASRYSLSHGEAVSIGMVAEARCAVAMGVLASGDDRVIEDVLVALGLPVRVPAGPELTPAAILQAARADKKARAGTLRCALPSAIGSMAKGGSGYGIPLDEAAALEVLAMMTGPEPPAA